MGVPPPAPPPPPATSPPPLPASTSSGSGSGSAGGLQPRPSARHPTRHVFQHHPAELQIVGPGTTHHAAPPHGRNVPVRSHSMSHADTSRFYMQPGGKGQVRIQIIHVFCLNHEYIDMLLSNLLPHFNLSSGPPRFHRGGAHHRQFSPQRRHNQHFQNHEEADRVELRDDFSGGDKMYSSKTLDAKHMRGGGKKSGNEFSTHSLV